MFLSSSSFKLKRRHLGVGVSWVISLEMAGLQVQRGSLVSSIHSAPAWCQTPCRGLRPGFGSTPSWPSQSHQSNVHCRKMTGYLHGSRGMQIHAQGTEQGWWDSWNTEYAPEPWASGGLGFGQHSKPGSVSQGEGWTR